MTIITSKCNTKTMNIEAEQLPSFGMEISINGKYADYVLGNERISVLINYDGRLCVTVERLECFDKSQRTIEKVTFHAPLNKTNKESAYAWARNVFASFRLESLERQGKGMLAVA